MGGVLAVTAQLLGKALVALIAGVAAAILLSAPVQAGPALPTRNTSGHANCSAEPGFPHQAFRFPFGGARSFPVVGSIDANGCDSWTYELAGSFGPYASFFTGTGFHTNQHAYQYGTQETTELIEGHQLIRVVNPTKEWRRIYHGYDDCTKRSGPNGQSITTCIAPAVERRPDDWVPWIPIGIALGVGVLFVVHYLRPAGPVRRKRHYRHAHRELAHAVPSDLAVLEGIDVRQLQKSLRRLEHTLSPELSESQHHWFGHLLSSGRHSLALESLARWLAESRMPVPDHVRDEVLWLASSLSIEREVRPVLDAQVAAHEDGFEVPTAAISGFDVPLDEFKNLVMEAVDSLPEAFGKAMSNVAIVIEEEHPDRDRFGQYEGHPLAAARYRVWALHPDKITIYRKTICEHCRSREEVRAQVYKTVIHEIAHHFGIDDPRLRELGW